MSSSTPSSSPTLNNRKEILNNSNNTSNFLNTPNITPKQNIEAHVLTDLNKSLTSDLMKSFETQKENNKKDDTEPKAIYNSPKFSPPLNRKEKSISNHPPLLLSPHAKNLFSNSNNNQTSNNFDKALDKDITMSTTTTTTTIPVTDNTNNTNSSYNTINDNNDNNDNNLIINNQPKTKIIENNRPTTTSSSPKKVDINKNQIDTVENEHQDKMEEDINLESKTIEDDTMDIDKNTIDKVTINKDGPQKMITDTIEPSLEHTNENNNITTPTNNNNNNNTINNNVNNNENKNDNMPTTIINTNTNSSDKPTTPTATNNTTTTDKIIHKKWNPKLIHRKRKSYQPVRAIDTSHCISEAEKCIEGIVKIEVYPILRKHPTFLIDTPKEAEHIPLERPIKLVTSQRRHKNHLPHSNSQTSVTSNFTYFPRLNTPPPKTYPISRVIRHPHYATKSSGSGGSSESHSTKKSSSKLRQHDHIGSKTEFPEESDTYRKMKYINPPPPVIWKKGVPLEITSETPLVELLNREEIETCSILRIQPTQYLRVRDILIKGYKKNGYYLKKDAKKWCRGIDVNKTAKLYDWWVDIGWLPFKEIILAEQQEKLEKKMNKK